MRHIPTMAGKALRESIEAFLRNNPQGATLDQVRFACGEDALLMGILPPSQDDIVDALQNTGLASFWSIQWAVVSNIINSSDDWMYQRIPCDVVDRIRRVLEAMEEATSFPAHFGGEDIAPLLEAIRIKEK